jgi:hypothetical protein
VAELHLNADWTALAKFDGEFASGARTYAATGTLRYMCEQPRIAASTSGIWPVTHIRHSQLKDSGRFMGVCRREYRR